MYEADPTDLIEFATRWTALGDANTEQVVQVVNNPDCGSCWNEGTENGVNPAAIEQARDKIGGYNEGLDEAIEQFLESLTS